MIIKNIMKKFLVGFYVLIFLHSNNAFCGGPKVAVTRTYFGDNGVSCTVKMTKGRGGGIGPDGYLASCKNAEGKSLYSANNDFNYIAYDDDGNVISEYDYNSSRITYIMDDKENIIGKTSRWNGPLIETYKYTEGGKMIVYDAEGNMKGAYNDLLDYHADCQGGKDAASVSCWNKLLNYVGNLSLPVNENGEFYDYAEDGKTILGIYATNGDITNYKYDDKGNLLNVTKNGDVIAENKYDAGGNLVASYENGIQTYHRTSYTIKEANDATPDSNGEYSVRLSF